MLYYRDRIVYKQNVTCNGVWTVFSTRIASGQIATSQSKKNRIVTPEKSPCRYPIFSVSKPVKRQKKTLGVLKVWSDPCSAWQHEALRPGGKELPPRGKYEDQRAKLIFSVLTHTC